MYLTDLADVLRAAGLPVTEVDGWRTRGYDGDGDGDPGDDLRGVECIVIHHTASSWAAAGDYPTLTIVRDGRSDLAGPLAQLGLGRSGEWYVVAAGRANHTGATFETWQANANALGIEAEAAGTGDARDWPPAQLDSYARGVAALAAHYGVPIERVLGHKEIAAPLGRKTDPSFDMDTFRAHVRTPTAGGFMADLTEEQQKLILENTGKIATRTSQALKKLERIEEDNATRHEASYLRERATLAQVTALSAGMKALAEAHELDGDALVAAVKTAAHEALQGLTVTLATKENP